MIDSQTQVRWLAVAAALIVLVVGPVTAGLVFGETTKTYFHIYDGRGWDDSTIAAQEASVHTGHVILLVPPGNADGAVACPALEPPVARVPMPTEVADPAAALTALCSDLETPAEGTALLIDKPFSWAWAFATVVLLLIGTLLTVATLAGRQSRRPVQAVRDSTPQSAYRPQALVVQDVVPPPPPPAAPPVLVLADLPGVRDVVREQGTRAKARSHVDGSGGYVALGDVLVWATPMGSGVAFPDDDVHVTVSVTSTLDGGSRS